MSLVPIPYRIAALTEEQNLLLAYPVGNLADIITDVKFRCDCCAKCCTRSFNGHVFLLDRDVPSARSADPASIEPAPDPEFCDQNGIFYVSGYALRARDDRDGSCWFLENGRCRIYDRRFSICRIYPSMLHREADERGRVDWRQVSGLGLHGEYDAEVPRDSALKTARETKEYEHAFLTQQIRFLTLAGDYFRDHGLRHVQKVYDEKMRRYRKGEPLTVMVYCNGQLEGWRIRKGAAPAAIG